jgi:SAM-dependent methyltransferase
MPSSALDLYQSSLTEGADRAPQALFARLRDGSARALPIARWLGPITSSERVVLDRCRGPVLDVGCGPGRHVHALAARGVLALGVDVSPTAVALARQRGAPALEASVFDRLPGSGTWRTALLLDGNIGIGGRPQELLRRVASLLTDDGEILIEVGAPGSGTSSFEVRLERPQLQPSRWFVWADVSVDDAHQLARAADLCVLENWADQGRWFVRVGRLAERS